LFLKRNRYKKTFFWILLVEFLENGYSINRKQITDNILCLCRVTTDFAIALHR